MYYPPLLSERIFLRLIQWIKENAFPLLSALISGILAHGFAFANKLPGYDDIGSTFDKGTTYLSGRWGLPLTSLLYPDQSMPWIYGMIALCLFAVSACFMLRLFHIKSKLLQSLFSSCVVVFPSLTCTVTYMFTLSAYATSFLLSVLAVMLIKRQTVKHSILAVFSLVLSLSIYQSYISITASLLVLLLIQALLQESMNPQKVLKTGIFYLLFLIVSLGTYYILTHIINHFLGIELGEYASSRISFRLSYLPTGIYQAYRSFILFFRDGLWGLIPTKLSRYCHIICIVSCILLFFTWFLSQKHYDWVRFSLLFVLIGLFPLSVNCMYLFVDSKPSSYAIHTLVLYGFVSVYLFAAVLIESCNLATAYDSKIKPFLLRTNSNLITFSMAVIICINIYVANGIYLDFYFRYENMYSLFTTIVTDASMMPEFNENTSLAFCGDYDEPDFFYDHFTYAYSMIGTDGFQPNRSARNFFMKYYLGLDIPILSKSEALVYEETAEYKEMPVYPYSGSMKFFGDTLVIKFS